MIDDKPYYSIRYFNLDDCRWHVGYSSYKLEFVVECLRECFDIVNTKYGWIPVSERLPEDRKEKMVYLSSNRITIAKYNEHRLPHTGSLIGWGYIPKNGYIDFENETVIAWMQLPGQYQNDEQEENR